MDYITQHLHRAKHLIAMAFKWQPEDVGPKYKGIIEYPGFHTTDSFNIAAMYAIGRVHQSYTAEDEGVPYVTDYPVVVSVDMQGFEPQVDYDAVKMVMDSFKAQLDDFLGEVEEEDTDDEILDKLQRYVDSGDFNDQDVGHGALDFLSQTTFAHFDTPIYYINELPNAAQIIRDYQQTGKIPDDVLMKATEQFRYTEDVSEGRIQAVWYVTPVANDLLRESDYEKGYEQKYPGFDVVDEDQAYSQSWSPSTQLVYEYQAKEQMGLPGVDRRVEYHGTTYKRLLEIAPELGLPEPPNPPYRG
jgi:hypothetical protein